MLKFYTFLVIFAVWVPNSIQAQIVNDTTTSHIIENSDKTSSPLLLAPRVLKIQTINANQLQKDSYEGSKGPVVFPGNILRFTISNPGVFLSLKPSDKARVTIYSNGVEMKGLCTNWYGSVSRFEINSGQVPSLNHTADIDIVFRRNDTTQSAWNFIYSSGKYFWLSYADINASIGWEGMSALDKDKTVGTVKVMYYFKFIFWLWLGLFTVMIIGFFLLATKSDILKDEPDGPYSLSKAQLLYWTTLIISAFIYTLLLTDITTTLNTSILLLLGVSLGTTGSASAIDTLFSQRHPDIPDKRHRSFFWDILSDGKTYSISRIQVFAWNIVLGLYFIIYTILNKSMPVFSDTLLFLAGFSSLSYLGGKLPENSNAKIDAGKEADPGKLSPERGAGTSAPNERFEIAVADLPQAIQDEIATDGEQTVPANKSSSVNNGDTTTPR